MRFKIPKIIKPFELGDYHEDLEGTSLHVWVNPPMKVLSELDELGARAFGQKAKLEYLNSLDEPDEDDIQDLLEAIEANNAQIFEWYSNILSQGDEQSNHISADEMRQIADTDPTMYTFIIEGVKQTILDHKKSIRKN